MTTTIIYVLVYIATIALVYYLVKRKYSAVNLTEINSLLSEILETNFKNSSLSNAAQSILIVLRRFYNTDYITILLHSEKTGKMSVIASNAGNDNLKKIEEYCNERLATMGRYSARVVTSKGGTLQYPSANERGIHFSSFTPLEHDNRLIGGILLENKDATNQSDKNQRMKLYDKVFKSTALVLQNVIYTENLISMTSTDQLTGVHNRRFIDMTLTEQLNIHRNLGMSFSVAIFDIDHFKKFNDTYGHQFGDIVLQEVAQYMKNNMGEDEWVARYGGEEFVLFFGRSNENEIVKKVEKLREGLSNLELTNGDITTNVTASFGIATFPKFNDSASGLIAKADQALYKSKENGRNRVTVA